MSSDNEEDGVLTLVTTLLDALGLMLVASGATAALWGLIGASALAAGGIVVLAGSWLAARQQRSSK
jgi:hypothetical protein